MGKLKTTIVNAWLTKYNVLNTYLVVLIDILRPIKPHKVGNAMTISKMSHYALFARSHRKFLERENASLNLYKRHVTTKFCNRVKPASVDVFIRIMLQELSPRRDAEFLLKNLGTPRPYARKIFDILIEDVQ